MIDIQIKSWNDIPKKLIKPFLSSAHIPHLRFALFCDILRYHKVKTKSISPSKLLELFTLVDWDFLSNPGTTALLPKYTKWFKTYHMPKGKLLDFTCKQFELLATYYQEFTDPEYQDKESSLKNLVSIITYLNHVHSHADVMSYSKKKHPDYWVRNCIIYAHANLTWFDKLYTIALDTGRQKNDNPNDGLGWTSTFLSVAESGVFGNIDQVHKANIHDVMTYLIKKAKESIQVNTKP
jgi:hypothetical protein